MKPVWRAVAGAAALCLALVLVCIRFVDRPVAAFFAVHQGARPLFQAMAAPSLLPLPIAIGLVVTAVVRRLGGRAELPHRRLYIGFSVATFAATAFKDELKYLFGRPWPDTWLKTRIYAFHPFDTFWYFGAFPSGHTSYIAAPMCVLWRLMPRYRLLWGGVVVCVMAGLVAANYHFVGDVIAGFFTGLAAASVTLVLLPDG